MQSDEQKNFCATCTKSINIVVHNDGRSGNLHKKVTCDLCIMRIDTGVSLWYNSVNEMNERTIQMTTYTINPITTDKKINAGVKGEWSMCAHLGIKRTVHDNARYDKDSDINVGDKHISVKAARFSLMAGSLCKGCTTFDEIWALYEQNVHSNCFVYITKDFTVYEMTLNEFKLFVYLFCGLERESKKNGGYLKIKARSESKKMLGWLAAQVAA